MPDDVIDYIYKELEKERALRSAQAADARVKTEIAGTAFSFPVSTLAEAPLAAQGMVSYACRFISNGRKGGEGGGAGTGVPCYYNPATDTWLTFHDNTAVTI